MNYNGVQFKYKMKYIIKRYRIIHKEHKSYGNGNKPAEGSLLGETGFKTA